MRRGKKTGEWGKISRAWKMDFVRGFDLELKKKATPLSSCAVAAIFEDERIRANVSTSN